MTDFSGLKDWIVIVAGNIFIAIFIVRTLGAYAKREYGDLVTNAIVAVFIAFFVYAPDQAIEFLKLLSNKVFGGK